METSHYLRHYSIWSLLLMFFPASHLWAGYGRSCFIWWRNTSWLIVGCFTAPGCPFTARAAYLFWFCSTVCAAGRTLEFVSAVVLCGLVEYFTSYFTELTHNGQRWWDYSGYFINLNGRICGEGLLVFGLGGVLVVYLLAPMLDDFIRRIPRKVLIPVCLTLVLCFLRGIQAYSSKVPNAGKGITEVQAAPPQPPPSWLFSEQPVVGGREAALWRRSV